MSLIFNIYFAQLIGGFCSRCKTEIKIEDKKLWQNVGDGTFTLENVKKKYTC